MKQKITPCLWYDGAGEKAAALYCSVLADAKIASRSPLVTELVISGQNLTLLDGGPMYKPNPSISLYYVAETAAEIDRIWNAFSDGGEVMMPLGKYPFSGKYGWITDRYGISWQLTIGKLSDTGGQRITPFFLFCGKQYGRVDDAFAHYSAIFKNAKTLSVSRYGPGEQPDEEGKVRVGDLEMNGQRFKFIESAHAHKFAFNEGVSLTIHCDTQEEIDYYWEKLTGFGGEESMCGWLKDKFGVSWQVVPTALTKIMSDPVKAGKAAKAFMSMRKLDIEQIVQASLA